jgi:hypothetical protein
VKEKSIINYMQNGFQTNVWGAPAWMFLHMVSLNYREEHKDGYKKFFSALQHVLPCGACRDNYKRIISSVVPLNDSVFENRNTVAKWLFQVHNQVQTDIFAKTKNEKDKPKYNNSEKSFVKMKTFYEQFRAKCVPKSHGCLIPVKGQRMRTNIIIKRFKSHRRRNAILVG